MSELVVSTSKMSVELNDDCVLKTFRPVYGFKKRFETEKQALFLLEGTKGVPQLLSFSFSGDHSCLLMFGKSIFLV